MRNGVELEQADLIGVQADDGDRGIVSDAGKLQDFLLSSSRAKALHTAAGVAEVKTATCRLESVGVIESVSRSRPL